MANERCKETIQYPNGIGRCTRAQHTDIFCEFVIDTPEPQVEIKINPEDDIEPAPAAPAAPAAQESQAIDDFDWNF